MDVTGVEVIGDHRLRGALRRDIRAERVRRVLSPVLSSGEKKCRLAGTFDSSRAHSR